MGVAPTANLLPIPASIMFAILLPALAWGEPFKLFLDNSRQDFIMAEKQDCSVHKGKDGRVTLGFKAGTIFFGIGPEITFGEKEGIDWDHMVQRLVARYQELCSRFNTGSITKQEYEARLTQIESIEKEGFGVYQEYLKEKSKKRQNTFDELDRETDRTNALQKSYNNVFRKLDTSE